SSLWYSTAATSNVTIKRKDGQNFKFYGVWLKYTNSMGYPAPYLTVSYNGSSAPSETYGANTTVSLTGKNVTVSSVTLMFSGLLDLNFDNLIVGPAAASLSASISSQTNVACFGGSNGSAGVSVTGGTGSYSYSWSPSGGSASTATGLSAGSYVCTVTDASLNTTTANVTITQPTTLMATVTVSETVSCNGLSDGEASVSVTGGVAPYTYL